MAISTEKYWQTLDNDRHRDYMKALAGYQQKRGYLGLGTPSGLLGDRLQHINAQINQHYRVPVEAREAKPKTALQELRGWRNNWLKGVLD